MALDTQRAKGWKRGLAIGMLAMMLGATTAKIASASAFQESTMDATALALLETRADNADQRDKAYLYTELLHGLTELAGRQLSAGQDDDAAKTVSHIDAIAAKVQRSTARNAKRLKSAEELLEHSARRLGDMTRLATEDQRAIMQATLQRLNHVHNAVLAMVFAK